MRKYPIREILVQKLNNMERMLEIKGKIISAAKEKIKNSM